MSRRFPGIRAISLVSCMMLIIAASAITFARTPVSSLDPISQCPFDPSGYFYAKEMLPAGFQDFDHLTLWEKHKKSDQSPRPGIYTARGEVYELIALKSWPFEFTTATVNGISYSFTGKFRMVCIFEEEVRRYPENVFAEGELLKFENGEKVAKTPVRFTYSPKLRELKDDVNALYPSGRTDLIYAAWEDDLTKVRALLARGANVNVRDKTSRQTALEYTIYFSNADESARTIQIAKLLIAAGADVNLKDDDGLTVLMRAVLGNHDLFKFLLSAGADVNAKDNNGMTVLMQAVSAALDVWKLRITFPDEGDDSAFENVRALIRAGARVNERNNRGDTALSMAVNEFHKYDQSALSKAQKNEYNRLINLLKRAGAR